MSGEKGKRRKSQGYIDNVAIPPKGVAGYFSKQGHLIKNWKRRFFVLDYGRLTYYKRAHEEGLTRIGHKMLGSMPLTCVEMDVCYHVENTYEESSRIYLNNIITGVDLLLQLPSEVMGVWEAALRAHIFFASSSPDMVGTLTDAPAVPWRLAFLSSLSPSREVRDSNSVSASRRPNVGSIDTRESDGEESCRARGRAEQSSMSEDSIALTMDVVREDPRTTNPHRLGNITQIW